MAFPLMAALAVYSALKPGQQGQGGPAFQLPQFNDKLPQLNTYNVWGRGVSAAPQPSPILQAAPGAAPADDKTKMKTKDYITQAFLGSLANAIFTPPQPSPYTFSPPVFR